MVITVMGLLSVSVSLLVLAVTLADSSPVQPTTMFCRGSETPIGRAVNELSTNIQLTLHDDTSPVNTLYSPLGISFAMGMAYLGAGGNTSAQMESVLGYENSYIKGRTVHRGFRTLFQNYLTATNNAYALNFGNGFFYNTRLHIDDNYEDNLRKYYKGEASPLDFENKPDKSTQTINDWADEKTNGMVKNFFSEPLPTDTQVVLTNAIYFKGTWKVQFPEKNTYTSGFYVGDKNVGNVDYMTLSEETLPYYKDSKSGDQFLELPYKGEELSMILVLQKDQSNNEDFLMSPNVLCHVTRHLAPVELDEVAIPKFKLEYETSLRDALQSLGMTDAFSYDADFSRIHDGLKISDVKHKAVIEVNEKGSEAAAVTGVVMQLKSSFHEESKRFIANRPFGFFIVHKKAGVVLFTGKVNAL